MNSAKTKTTARDMTRGPILQLLIAFALPLMLGNVFQMLYNTVDSVIVGNFVSKQALAAIGSTTVIVNMLVFFFNGFSIGAAVLISRYFGADYMLVAHSGQGIDRNYGDFGRGFAMPERYLNTFDCVEGSPAWKPSGQKPDLTVIYLCTNDFSTGRQPTIGEFRRHYIQLLKAIKDNYGPAHKILCVAGPSDELMPQYVRSAVEASGLEQVWSVNLCPMAINMDSDLGASWHPNYAGQTKWAYALLPYVATITGWPLEASILQ